MPHRLIAPLVALVIGLTALSATADSAVQLGDDPLLASLEVTAFATGLNFPTGMVELPDGSILVATSTPAGGSFFQSTGELLRLTDEDEDGVADDAGTILATGLPGTLVSLARAGDLVLTTSAEGGNEQIVVLRRGERWADPLDPVGSLRFYLDGFEHQSYGLAARPSPDVDGSYEVVFNVGASANESAGRIAYTQGLVETQLWDASLYRMTITDSGDGLTISEPEQIATGLRNAAAITFDPATGDLVITDNGIDTPEDRIVALSADELYRLPADEIGGEVEDYGFPAAYVDYATGEEIGGQAIAPVVAYRPIDGPRGASEAEGVASVALAPASFPKELQGVVAGFHGQYDSVGIENEENPLLLSDESTGDSIELFANDDPEIGHIDGLLSTETTLYAADLCDGSLVEPDPCGTIYAVRVER